jgi:riboflavin synthase
MITSFKDFFTMFTGLIEAVGTVDAITPTETGSRLSLQCPLAAELGLGDSLAVNGVCLTVAAMDGEALHFDLLHQTTDVTNLGDLSEGNRVNLERPLAFGGRLDGHLVSGHVDTVAKVIDNGQTGEDWVLTVALPAAQRPLIIDKGSIAINGVSLTVAHLADDRFSVHLIPHTVAVTNLGDLQTGSPVNLEMDMVGKFVLRNRQLMT